LPRLRNMSLMALWLAALALASLAKNTKLTGRMVAYDVMRHNAKSAAAMQNQEVVILETDSRKRKGRYVKIMFSSFGTTQIDPKYFDGSTPLTVDVFRDNSCNESFPNFVSQVSVEQMGGTYLLTDAYKTSSPGRIKMLECYAAIQKKK
jgi:hypothetical protein